MPHIAQGDIELKKPGIIVALTSLGVFASAGVLADTVEPPPAPDLGLISMVVEIDNVRYDQLTLNWGTVTDPVTGATVYRLWNSPSIVLSDGSSFTINSASFDPDPVLSLAGSAINNTANPLTFSFSFNAPMSPALLGGINSAALLHVGLTDVAGDGASVAPLAGDTNMLRSFDLFGASGSVSKNVDVGTALQLFALGSAQIGGQDYSATGSLQCLVACTVMSARMSFVLSPGDNMSFNGVITQTAAPVPLPAGIWFLGTGLAGLAGFRRRRAAALA